MVPLRQGAPPGISWLHRSGWLAAGVLAVVLPPLWVWTGSAPPVPEQVKAHWVEGKITVVDLTDFECPSCRRAEPDLVAFRNKMGDKIHFVRLVAPIQRHANAKPAGRAYLAAEKQGKGEAMAAALFAAPNLEPAECRKLAAKVGLNLADYDRVVSDPATDAVLDDTNAWVYEVGKAGVPQVWVGDQLVTSPLSPERLALAFRKAQRSAAGVR
jgi:protein-disulfide isomerase